MTTLSFLINLVLMPASLAVALLPGAAFFFGGVILAHLLQVEQRQVILAPDIEDEMDVWEDLKGAAEEFLRDQCRHNRHRLERALEDLA